MEPGGCDNGRHECLVLKREHKINYENPEIEYTCLIFQCIHPKCRKTYSFDDMKKLRHECDVLRMISESNYKNSEMEYTRLTFQCTNPECGKTYNFEEIKKLPIPYL